MEAKGSPCKEIPRQAAGAWAGSWDPSRQAGFLQALLARAAWGVCTTMCKLPAHRQESCCTDLAPSSSNKMPGRAHKAHST